MAKLRSFSEDQILKRIRLENPWWETNSIPAEYDNLRKRLYFDLLYKQVSLTSVKRATVLMGPRRVGKTVMLFQLVQQLISQGVSSRKICFLSVDAPIYNNIPLEDLFNLCRKALQDNNAENYYVIFDEIQYLKNWEVHLKSMVDFYSSTNRFIVSGSAAAALKLKSNESGAGRFTEFMLPPLTFHEYLHLKAIPYQSYIAINDWTSLNDHFLQYINYGGYPEVIFSDIIQQDPGKFIRSDIIDKVLLRDLPSLYGIRDVQELNSLFNVIAYNSGNEFNLEGLAQESGVDKNTIRKYIEYLEAAFLIKIIYPVGINTKKFQRASRFKIYLTNPSMRCALFAPIVASEDHFGQMVETALVAQYLHQGNLPMHFAAWKGGEVDLVMVNPNQKPKWVVEVKWSNQYLDAPQKLKSLIKYCKENKVLKAGVTTIDRVGKATIQDLTFYYTPASNFCILIGKESIEKKQSQPTTAFFENDGYSRPN